MSSYLNYLFAIMNNTNEAARRVRQLEKVAVRFSGDSGDGMQLAGNIFTNVSAMLCAIRPAPRIATLICAMKSPCFELPVCYVAMTSVRHMRRRHALCEND